MKTTFLSLVLAVTPWSGFAGNDAIENYVAHEWGTFTSVQGADSVLIPWNPSETTQLPKFVLLKQIVRYSESDAAGRREAVANVRQLGLGRFLQPVVAKVLGNYPSREFSQAAWELMNAAVAKRNNGESLANW